MSGVEKSRREIFKGHLVPERKLVAFGPIPDNVDGRVQEKIAVTWHLRGGATAS